MASTLLSKHSLCANGEADESQTSPCEAPATKFCSRCSLVQYCSQVCQSKHWTKHKVDCNSPLAKPSWRPSYHNNKQQPIFTDTISDEDKSFWSEMPAIDLLMLKDNEGAKVERDFDILFPISGDFGSVVKTVVGLPENYQSRCRIVVNHQEEDVTIRNALLVLVALSVEPHAAATVMIHLWYSTMISAEILDLIQAHLSPMIQDACSRPRPVPNTRKEWSTWCFHGSSLSVMFHREGWHNFLAYFTPPQGLSMDEAFTIRRSTTMNPSITATIDRQLFNLAPHERVAQLKFRKEGMLLPFGASREGFDVPNPILFRHPKRWPIHQSSSPLTGWTINDVSQKATAAQHDRYGALYHYLNDLFCEFCTRVQNCRIEFEVYNEPIEVLPAVLKNKALFDRIHVSHLVELAEADAKMTLEIFGHYLRDYYENPHATLITLFVTSAVMTKRKKGKIYSHPTLRVIQQLREYLPTGPGDLNIMFNDHMYSAEFWRYISARDFFGNDEEYFIKSMKRKGFEDIAKSTTLEMKEVNSVTEPWPLKLKDGTSAKDFGLLIALTYHGCERYVEWKRKSPNHQTFAAITAALKILAFVKSHEKSI